MTTIPADLHEDAAVLYRSLVARHPHLERAVQPLLVLYCQTYALLLMTEEQVAIEAAKQDGDPPQVLVGAVADLRKTLSLLARELGIASLGTD